VTYPVAWEADGLLAKSKLYFERAFELGSSDPAFPVWCHLAIELLARAAIASISPVLLADRRKPKALHYAIGIADLDPLEAESVSSAELYALCERYIDNFGNAERSVCEQARKRRNAELHSATAAMIDLPPGWLGRLFATCRVLVEHLGLKLSDLLTSEDADLVEQLIVDDAHDVQSLVREAIEQARRDVASLAKKERSIRVQRAHALLHSNSSPLGDDGHAPSKAVGRVLREIPCPACKTPIALVGEVVTRSPARISSDGELVEALVAIPSELDCSVCGLRLDGISALTVAGLGDPVTLTEYPDPVEAFDIDLSDYQDQFLRSLADDYAYRDE